MNASDLNTCRELVKLKWFTFYQNNSGGKFRVDNDVDTVVIIQANNGDEANELAELIGIYFNGVDQEMDCPCCGDRWSTISSSDKGDDIPTHYGEPVSYCNDSMRRCKGVVTYPYNIIRNRK